MPLTTEELEPLLRLGLTRGIGPQRLSLLVERFGSAERAMAAGSRELQSVVGVGEELASRIRAASTLSARRATEAALRQLDRLKAVVLSPNDASYPSAFHQLPDR